jgi:MFS family permease
VAITAQHPTAAESEGSQRGILIGIVVAVIVILAIIIGGVILLLQPTTDTARIRDIFIIFMAIESLLLGVTLVILIVQLARLINLLQNEIKPILDSTNETVSNLRGTTSFLSDNLVQPVIKMNEYLAGLTQALKLVGLARRRPKP